LFYLSGQKVDSLHDFEFSAGGELLQQRCAIDLHTRT